MEDKLQQLYSDFRTIRRLLANRFQTALQTEDLSTAQTELLFTIVKHPVPMQPKQLATCLNLTPGAITQLLDGLEQAGYIKRVHSDQDRRISLVSLSEAAAAKIAHLKAYRDSFASEIASLLTESEITTLLMVEQKLLTHLQTKPTSLSPNPITPIKGHHHA